MTLRRALMGDTSHQRHNDCQSLEERRMWFFGLIRGEDQEVRMLHLEDMA